MSVFASVLLPALALAVPADDPPVITDVEPTFGAVGGWVRLEGSGFGTGKKPKVWLSPVDAPDVRRSFRVLTASDEALLGYPDAPTLPAGEYTLHVDPKGSAPAAAAATTFTVVEPHVHDFQPKSVAPGGLVEITGTGFGSKQGWVHLGQQALKVVSWGPERIIVRPKKTKIGVLRVKSRSGEDLAPCALKVKQSPQYALTPIPAASHHAYLSGDIELGFGDEQLRVQVLEQGELLRLQGWGTALDGTFSVLEVQLSTVPSVGEPWPQATQAVDWVRLLRTDGSLDGQASWSVFVPPLQHVHGIDWTIGSCWMSGWFELELAKVAGPGPDTLLVGLGAELDIGRIEIVEDDALGGAPPAAPLDVAPVTPGR